MIMIMVAMVDMVAMVAMVVITMIMGMDMDMEILQIILPQGSMLQMMVTIIKTIQILEWMIIIIMIIITIKPTPIPIPTPTTRITTVHCYHGIYYFGPHHHSHG